MQKRICETTFCTKLWNPLLLLLNPRPFVLLTCTFLVPSVCDCVRRAFTHLRNGTRLVRSRVCLILNSDEWVQREELKAAKGKHTSEGPVQGASKNLFPLLEPPRFQGLGYFGRRVLGVWVRIRVYLERVYGMSATGDELVETTLFGKCWLALDQKTVGNGFSAPIGNRLSDMLRICMVLL